MNKWTRRMVWAAAIISVFALSGCGGDDGGGDNGELRADLIGTWKVMPDNNPTGFYYINTYHDDGTTLSEEHIPGDPVEIYQGTFTVSGNKLHLDWGGGDTYTTTISIDGDTLRGTDMDGGTFTGIRQ